MKISAGFLQLCVLALVAFPWSAPAAEDAQYPNRVLYPEVPVIEKEDLHAALDRHVVVDVRSPYEYQTLRIKGALNVPLARPDFVARIRDLVERHPDRTIAFYCNGKTCRKSYKAARRALRAGVKKVVAYDAGIFDWARAYPDRAELLGRSPVDPRRLISREAFERHLLSPDDFLRKARGGQAIVLDIRDPAQREGISLLAGEEHAVPLGDERLAEFVALARRSGKPLLVYDAVGKQVRWLQYYLEQQGLRDYWFMKGGARAFYDQLLGKYR